MYIWRFFVNGEINLVGYGHIGNFRLSISQSQIRVPPLFQHWFSMTKKWKSMTYLHNIYFQVNDIQLMNAYQN